MDLLAIARIHRQQAGSYSDNYRRRELARDVTPDRQQADSYREINRRRGLARDKQK